MSTETFHKIKAIMLIVMLSVAEGRRVDGSINQGVVSRSGAALPGVKMGTAVQKLPAVKMGTAVQKFWDAGGPQLQSKIQNRVIVETSNAAQMAAVPLFLKLVKHPRPKTQEELVSERMTKAIRHLWTHVSKEIEATLSDAKVQERGDAVAQIVEVLKWDPVLQQQAGSLAELMGAMKDDSTKQEVATLVAKDLEAMMADRKFQEQLKEIERQLETDPNLEEQLSAMMGSWQAGLVLKQWARAMITKPLALVEISKASVQESAKAAFNPLKHFPGRHKERVRSQNTSTSSDKVAEYKKLAKGKNSQWAALGMALATTLVMKAFVGEPWACSKLLDMIAEGKIERVLFSQDGKKATALDTDGYDHDVQLFPAGESELLQELRKRDIPFAVDPPQSHDAVLSVLGDMGAFLFASSPLLLVIGVSLATQ